ncbi:hypothetical protein AB7C87_00145 [Natrarchaeobius sp. A-rgal3]|uniref:hypothetical protein n=1 Tax=Natrarchaeobius versutus TaxID=1679078 RepID=UPI00350F6B82
MVDVSGDGADAANGSNNGTDAANDSVAATDGGGASVADETPTTSTASGGDGFVAVLAAAVDRIRSEPGLAAPFVLAGILGAASSVARIASPYPIGVTPFPQRGLLSVSAPFVPNLEPAIEIGSSILPGMKPPFLLGLVAWQVTVAAVTTVAFAVVLWRFSPGMSETTSALESANPIPPLRRIGRLLALVLAVQCGFFGVTFVAGVLGGGTLGIVFLAMLIVVALSAGLFLTPAYLVLEGSGLREGALESVDRVLERPISAATLVVGLGYLSYAVTGVGTLVPSTTVGVFVGTVASVAVVGTIHAAVVVTAYRRWGEQTTNSS